MKRIKVLLMGNKRVLLVCLCPVNVYTLTQADESRGAIGGGTPPPEFHTLAKDMSPNRGATHFTLGLRPCIISSFLL